MNVLDRLIHLFGLIGRHVTCAMHSLCAETFVICCGISFHIRRVAHPSNTQFFPKETKSQGIDCASMPLLVIIVFYLYFYLFSVLARIFCSRPMD